MSTPKPEPETKPVSYLCLCMREFLLFMFIVQRSKSTIPPRGTTPAPSVGQKHSLAAASNNSTAKRAKFGTSTGSLPRGVTPTPARGTTPAAAGRSRGMGLTTPLASRAPSSTSRVPLHNSAALNNHAKATPSQISSATGKLNAPAPVPSAPSNPSRPIPLSKTGFGYAIGLGPPPKSPTRLVSNASDGSISSSSTIRLVSGASSGSTAASTLRTFSANSFRTPSGMDVATLVRRASFKPRPSFNDFPMPPQTVMEPGPNWTTMEESDDDDVFDDNS